MPNIYPQRLKGSYISVLVGDGGNPETFLKICGATSKSLTAQKNTSDDFLDNCGDPEALPPRSLSVTSKQWSIALNIIYNRTQVARIRALATSSVSSNFRFDFSEKSSDQPIDAGYWLGLGQVVNFQVTGEGNGIYATGTLTIESDGEWIWSDSAIPINALLSPIDGRVLQSPVDQRILLKPNS